MIQRNCNYDKLKVVHDTKYIIHNNNNVYFNLKIKFYDSRAFHL